jgi:DNA-binding response OmpR family regulator
MAKTVLLVEDNEQLNSLNRRALEMVGYDVLTSRSIARARQHVLNPDVHLDVILLDISLPDGNGVDFCKEIRSKTSAHILFLTAVQDDETLLNSLDIGGDDYITKPYKLEEMLARVKVAMRRRGMTDEKAQKPITRDTLSLDPIGHLATLDGKDMQLTTKEFFILYYLVIHEGEVLSSENLYKLAWNQEMLSDDHAVKNTVYRLRQKLESKHSHYKIAAVRNKGYRFEAQED